MLRLDNITKIYKTSSLEVHALNGVSLCFRKSEFISILGPSGCGKTTMLNIIGGLDKYTSGDLLINNTSTKKYNDHDWDIYRNHRIGFIFQSYNLIPQENILENVELALTIGGIPARYVKAPGRYHAFACDSLHLYEIGATRKDAATMTSFRIDGNIVAIATGMNIEMMRRGMTAMANAILAYKAKSHRQSKELRKRKRAARKAEKMAAEEGGAK